MNCHHHPNTPGLVYCPECRAAEEEAVAKAVSEAGIVKWVTLRTFRHSYATNLLHAGVDIRTLQMQLGHTDVKTTEIYAHAIGSRGTASPLDRVEIAGNVIDHPWRARASA